MATQLRYFCMTSIIVMMLPSFFLVSGEGSKSGFLFPFICGLLFEEIPVGCNSVAHEERCFLKVRLRWPHNGHLHISVYAHS